MGIRKTALSLAALSLLVGAGAATADMSFEDDYARRLEAARIQYEKSGKPPSLREMGRMDRKAMEQAWSAMTPERQEAWRRDFQATVAPDREMVEIFGSLDNVRSPMDFADRVAKRLQAAQAVPASIR